MTRGLSSGMARKQVERWVKEERAVYADKKYAGSNHSQIRTAIKDGDHEATIDGFLSGYLDRAKLFGLDTEQGRQALGKAAVTLLDFLEHAVVLHGDMPEPGHTSGEIKEWAFA